jgi:hypothetical protein
VGESSPEITQAQPQLLTLQKPLPLPRYELPPPIDTRESPSLPPSPTTDLHKRRRIQKERDNQKGPNDLERRMSVDDGAEPVSKEANRPDTNKPEPLSVEHRPSYEVQEAKDSPSLPPQENSTRVDVDKAEIERVLASLDAASENKKSEGNLGPQASLRDKYTSGPM